MILGVVLLGALLALGYWYFTRPSTTPLAQPEPKIVKVTYGPDWDDTEYEGGSHLTSYYMGRANYKTSDGTYAPIDTNVQTLEDADLKQLGYVAAMTHNDYHVYFKQNAQAQDAVRFQVGDAWVAYTFVDAHSAELTYQDNVLTYPAIYDGMDLRYTLTNGTLLEEFVVQKNDNVKDIVQKLTLGRIRLQQMKDGSIEFSKGTGQEVLWSFPAPLMYADNDHTDTSNGLQYSISKSGSSTLLTRRITDSGRQWLAKATYPVAIDATATYCPGNTSNPCTGQTLNLAYWPGWQFGQCTGPNPGCLPQPPLAFTAGCPGAPQCAEFTGPEYTDMRTDNNGSFVSDTCSHTNFTWWCVSQHNFRFRILPGGANFPAAANAITQIVVTYSGKYSETSAGNIVNPTRAAEIQTDGAPLLLGNLGLADATFTQTITTDNNLNAITDDADYYLDSSGDLYVRAYEVSGSTASWLTAPSQTIYSDFVQVQVRWVNAPDVVLFNSAATTTSSVSMNLRDQSTDEEQWLLARSTTGANGSWANVQNISTGGTQSNMTCGIFAVSYNCSATSSAGTGGICDIQNNCIASFGQKLQPNTSYYYRVQSVDTGLNHTSAWVIAQNASFSPAHPYIYTLALAPANPMAVTPSTGSILASNPHYQNTNPTYNNPANTSFYFKVIETGGGTYYIDFIDNVSPGGPYYWIGAAPLIKTAAQWGSGPFNITTKDTGTCDPPLGLPCSLRTNVQYDVILCARNGDGIDACGPSSKWYTLAKLPTNLRHDAPPVQTTSSMTWRWDTNGNPAGTQFYARDSSGHTTVGYGGDVDGWIPDLTSWAVSGYSPNQAITINVKARNGDNVETAEVPYTAYTSQNPPSNLNVALPADVNNSQSLELSATTPANNPFAGQSGSQFVCNTSPSNGCDSPSLTSLYAYTDIGLFTNAQYCYQVRYKNGDGDPTTLYPLFLPGTCKYTRANIPSLPELSRVDSSTIKLKIRVNNNPPPTQFAVRARYTDSSGAHEKCVDFATKQLTLDCPPLPPNGDISQPQPPGQDHDWWHTLAEWDPNGFNVVNLDANLKYRFSVKARNGDNVETPFGLDATLFLVAQNIVGWGWASTIGWISTNCLNLFNEAFNPGLQYGYSCSTANDWGLNTDFDQNREVNPVTGYAWSSNAGWVSANVGVCTNNAQKSCKEDIECSASGATTWTNTGNLTDPAMGDALFVQTLIQGSSACGGTIYAGTGGAGSNIGEVFTYNPGTDTWTKLGDFDKFATSVQSLLQTHDCTLLAGAYTKGEIYKYDPSLNTWNSIKKFAGTSEVHDLIEVQEGAGYAIYAATSSKGDVFKSTNGGTTWANTGNLADGAYDVTSVYDLLQASSGTIYAGTGSNAIDFKGDVYQYFLATNSWTKIGDVGQANNVYTLLQDNTGALFAGTFLLSAYGDGEVFKSTDQGVTWVQKSNFGNTVQSVYALLQASSGTIYAATGYNGEIYESSNGGTTWQKTTSLPLSTYAFSLLQASNGTIYAGTGNNGDVFKNSLAPAVCLESAGTPPPPTGSTYGYCYNGANLRHGTCKRVPATPCTETNQTTQCSTEGDYCVFATCSSTVPCTGGDSCKLSSTANFNNVTQEVEGQVRILSLKDYGTSRGFSDWGWAKLKGKFGGPGVDKDTLGVWHFTENGTDPKTGDGFDVYDSSFNRRNGTLGANGESPQADDPGIVALGKYGPALSFDGTNDVVNVANVSNVGNEFTVEGWVKPTDTNDGRTIISKAEQNASIKGWMIDLRSTGHVRFVMGDGAAQQEVQSTSTLTNQWQYIAAVKTAANGMKLYINGQPASPANSNTTFANSAQNVRIGFASIPTNTSWNGQIDEVRLTNRALTETEIDTEFKNAGPYIVSSTSVNSLEFLGDPNIDPNNVVLYTMFGWGWSGASSPGIGWISFIPATALLGIPYIETQYGDVLGRGGIELAPPPRASGRYNATFLLISEQAIKGVPGFYPSSTTTPPTSGLQGSLNPLIENYVSGLPTSVLSQIDTPGLVTMISNCKDSGGFSIACNDPAAFSGLDRYGYTVERRSGGDISNGFTAIGTTPTLANKIYYFTGPSSINTDMEIKNGSGSTSGAGLIVVDGNLAINANVRYDSAGVSDLKRLASAAWIVNGRIDIAPVVSDLAGVFVAKGSDPVNPDGVISTSLTGADQGIKPFYLNSTADDVTALPASFTSAGSPKFGWENASSSANRAFLKFGFQLPKASEIKSANLILKPTGGTGDISARAAVLDSVNPDITTANPYNLGIMQESFFSVDSTWTGPATVSIDVTRLVQTYVESSAYDGGSGHSIGFRLRRGTNEDIAPEPPADQYRSFQEVGCSPAPCTPTRLDVTYRAQLSVSGMLIAETYNFAREYKRGNEPSEKVSYDGRVIANTPPGLEDFSQSLPQYNRVIQ